ncbi:hypothetical protein F8154_07405 [Alkaliphilus pronyensis]|uniref:Lipoprotein n=1 Tax=Alkaliphilus pronyensis TaxID=1482732 RepID=A0A6I0F5G5_9FIRM|nr:hypothetical protein [Alkaliphilus pronyensis]KAB3535259.1 hypothetical protein F8154_07405 [Alkaliphilus pronyensis]
MKKLSLFNLILLITMLFVGCNNANSSVEQLIYGEYEFDKLIYLSSISSNTFEAEEKSNLGIKYIIEDDKFTIIHPKDSVFSSKGSKSLNWSNLIYIKKEVIDTLIEGYVDANFLKEAFFSKYSEGYRYTIRDENNLKIGYLVFLMDDDLFVCEGNEEFMMALYKIKRIQ